MAERLQPPRRVEVRVEPGVPGVDQVQHAGDQVIALEVRARNLRQFRDGGGPAASIAEARQVREIDAPLDRPAGPALDPQPVEVREPVRATSRFASAFRSVDLPTLDRPTRAMCGTPSFGMPSASTALVTKRASRTFKMAQGSRLRAQAGLRPKPP